VEHKVIKPVQSLQGNVLVPGDKSISHRSLILSAIAEGEAKIHGLSGAGDVLSTQGCLKALGVSIKKSGDSVIVKGKGKYGLKKPKKTLEAGNSGTTIRLLTGILAAQNFVSVIDGDDSLRNRPMRRIIEPLESMGAHIESNGYKAPMTIHGGSLHAIDYASTVASAQVKSCVLLAGLYAKGSTRVSEPATTRDHTERMLEVFGVKIRASQSVVCVQGPAELHALDIDVPGDLSAAAFFLVAACLLPNSQITIDNVGVNPTRIGILDALTAMGGRIDRTQISNLNNEPRCSLTAVSTRLSAANFGGSMIPTIIDEIPILAVAATQAEGNTVIRDAGELRVKESDRLAAVAHNLTAMGAQVKETKDGLIIHGPTPLQGAEIDSFGDHRIAMSFAIAGLLARGETIIKGSECVDISFPGFYELLEKVSVG
jgi:3-phosphoshikimate 1-carboxyvinyltransferase